MDDLISRLSELRCQYNCFDDNERDAYHTLSEAIKALSDVPDTNVGDLISRQAALNALSAHKEVLLYIMDKCGVTEEVNKTLEIICNVPSADAVEVVRCKDCKHHIFDGDRWLCKLLSNNYEPVVEMDDDGYCSYGDKGGE